MKREDCYLTFSDALEQYLRAREEIRHFGEGCNRENARKDMQIAAEHMDALTSLGVNHD